MVGTLDDDNLNIDDNDAVTVSNSVGSILQGILKREPRNGKTHKPGTYARLHACYLNNQDHYKFMHKRVAEEGAESDCKWCNRTTDNSAESDCKFLSKVVGY